MPADQLLTRMLSSVSVHLGNIRSGKLSEDDWPRITGATKQLQDAKIFIDDTPALTPTELRARARRIKREHGLDLIVVDYLQLMSVPGTKENRATEISEISRGLKALAKENQCPVIALSQLNRGVEQRENKRPVMSDLRECVTENAVLSGGWPARADRRTRRKASRKSGRSMTSSGAVPARAQRFVWSTGVKPVIDSTREWTNGCARHGHHRVMTGNGWKGVSELPSESGSRLHARSPSRDAADGPRTS